MADQVPRIRRTQLPGEALIVVRGEDWIDEESVVQAERFRRRFPDWGGGDSRHCSLAATTTWTTSAPGRSFGSLYSGSIWFPHSRPPASKSSPRSERRTSRSGSLAISAMDSNGSEARFTNSVPTCTVGQIPRR